jgi:glycosyltransferase involved in cell wall biosynthesis
MITDTSMVLRDGQVYAFGPVVRELFVFEELFKSITWIGFNRLDLLNDNSMLPVPCTVNCIMLNASGGKTFFKKLGVLMQTPNMFYHILKNILRTDVIHVRAPSTPAIIAILLSFIFTNKIWWNKYAGNWGEPKPPFSYNLQRYLLRNAKFSKVTVNGIWDKQPKHLLSFENPCLNLDNRIDGKSILKYKKYTPKFHLCFVGHLTFLKGADILLEALKDLKNITLIDTVHIIGSGELYQEFQKLCSEVNFKIIFHGYISNSEVHEVMKLSHFLILPSRSEGFPKVVAEASNYGCIPIVSDISSISQIVLHNRNGFLLHLHRLENRLLSKDLLDILYFNNLHQVAHEAFEVGELFTFQRYATRIKEQIINAC